MLDSVQITNFWGWMIMIVLGWIIFMSPSNNHANMCCIGTLGRFLIKLQILVEWVQLKLMKRKISKTFSLTRIFLLGKNLKEKKNFLTLINKRVRKCWHLFIGIPRKISQRYHQTDFKVFCNANPRRHHIFQPCTGTLYGGGTV